MITDFEVEMFYGIKFSYEKCRMRYCAFHFSQAVFKKVFDAGLKNLYIQDVKSRLYIKCLLALIFASVGHRFNSFVTIKNWILSRNKNDIRLIFFLKYFEKNWITKIFFNQDDLFDRISKDIPLTNNHAEGFHSGFEK